MDLKLDGEALQALLQKSIVDALGAVGQEALIKEMVRYMTTEPPSSGLRTPSPSPLMGSLRHACEIAATQYLNKKIVEDEAFRTALDAMYTEGIKRFFEGDGREKTVNAIAERMSKVFNLERY